MSTSGLEVGAVFLVVLLRSFSGGGAAELLRERPSKAMGSQRQQGEVVIIDFFIAREAGPHLRVLTCAFISLFK